MTYRLPRLLVSFSIFTVLLTTGALTLSAQGNGFIVTFEPGTSRGARAAAAARHGASVKFNFGIIDAIAVTVPNENAARAFLGESSVRSITPDFEVHATQAEASNHAGGNGKPGSGGSGTPSSQVVPLGVQRVLKYVGAPTGAEGEGIGVAVVDTGIDLSHKDLNVQPDSFSAYNQTTPCQDDNDHGTHVAGIIAALNNSQDVVGVAPGVSLYCVKVLNAQGNGTWSTIIAGLDWIYNNGNPKPIKVVNMSLGGSGSDVDSPFRQAITRLHDLGITVVVAAGNDATLDASQQVPAAYTGVVLTVASTTATSGVAGCGITVQSDTASYFTSDGTGVTISAPGEDRENVSRQGTRCYLNSDGILSLKRGGGTTRMSGTSMSTPHVSGIVARLLQSPSSFGMPALIGNGSDVEAVRSYLIDSVRGADRQSTAPLDSAATSYTFDTIREGVAVVKPVTP
jgi:subtilisin